MQNVVILLINIKIIKSILKIIIVIIAINKSIDHFHFGSLKDILNCSLLLLERLSPLLDFSLSSDFLGDGVLQDNEINKFIYNLSILIRIHKIIWQKEK